VMAGHLPKLSFPPPSGKNRSSHHRNSDPRTQRVLINF
jgi:hypothetical protein